MMKEPLIINGGLKLWPDCFLSLRRGKDFIELVTTKGTVIIEGLHLEHLIRRFLHGQLRQLKDKEDFGFGCRVDTVTMKHSRLTPRHDLPFPDSCLLPVGWLCIEGEAFADYHPTGSLQIIGPQRDRFVLGFALNTYEVRPIDGEADELSKQLMEDFSKDAHHLTAWSQGGFLAWPPSKRLHVAAIHEVPHRPDSWDSMDLMVDLRGKPEQQAFLKRLPEPATPAIGMDR